jgi:hypothetical protein
LGILGRKRLEAEKKTQRKGSNPKVGRVQAPLSSHVTDILQN